MKGNREYKSDVFSMLMEEKENALEVYNAVNNTHYTDPELVEMKTLDNHGFSLSVRNDAAFMIDASLSIYEHQSTICPNMPIRGLVYYTIIVQDIIKGKNVYGSKKIPLPRPNFIIFYNAEASSPEYQEVNLSDLYMKTNN